EVVAPEAVAPDVVAPEVVAPDVVAPDAVTLATASPMALPEVVAPEAAAPDTVAAPVTAAPAAGERAAVEDPWWYQPPDEIPQARRPGIGAAVRASGRVAGLIFPWGCLAAVAGLWVFGLSRVQVGLVPTAGFGLVT